MSGFDYTRLIQGAKVGLFRLDFPFTCRELKIMAFHDELGILEIGAVH
jgi:hypothetical protein